MPPPFCNAYEPADKLTGPQDLRDMSRPFEKIWPINWKYFDDKKRIDAMAPCSKLKYLAVLETDSDSMDGLWNPNVFQEMPSTTVSEECDDRKVNGGMIISASKLG